MHSAQLFLALTLIFGLISSALWLASALVTHKPQTELDSDGWYGGSIQDSQGNDVVQTLERQSKYNKWAAFLSALTALSQIIYTAQNWPVN